MLRPTPRRRADTRRSARTSCLRAFNGLGESLILARQSVALYDLVLSASKSHTLLWVAAERGARDAAAAGDHAAAAEYARVARILEELEGLYLALQNGQFGVVHEEWVSKLETIGRRVLVEQGTERISGVAVRVDGDGALVVRRGDRSEVRVLAGDVI